MAIPNMTLDLNGGHFLKWPPEYTCLIISLNPTKSLRKVFFCVQIYIFKPKYYKKDNNKYANLTFDLNGDHFKKWTLEYTCFNISISNPRGQIFLVSKHTFSEPIIIKKTIIRKFNI